MNRRRGIVLASILALALTLLGLATACDGQEEAESPRLGTQDLQVALEQVTAMVAAAEIGNLEAAEAAFEAAHDPLHEVIETLAAADPGLSQDLDEAVEDAEKDFEEGEEAEHIVEIGNEILGLLLRQAVAP